MPFCSQCGSHVGEGDVYCGACGQKQPVDLPRPWREPKSSDPLAGISTRTAKILCYIPVVGWIAAIIVLASDRFRQDRDARFHAFQGLYLFVVWLIVDWVVEPVFFGFPGGMFRIGKILQGILIFTWIFMLVKTSQEETYSLPIIGELAEKSASERS
jgi:uncharacterized membrane protein